MRATAEEVRPVSPLFSTSRTQSFAGDAGGDRIVVSRSATGGNGADGGNGGNGGNGTATVLALDVEVTGGLDLFLYMAGFGADGALGGAGGIAGWGSVAETERVDGVGSRHTTATHAMAGGGGDGGDGGTGRAQLLGSRIVGSDAVDWVEIELRGVGGLGVSGAAGAVGVADSTVTSGTTFVQTYVTVGTIAGTAGIAGTSGQGVVTMTGNVIELGGGTDKLTLKPVAYGPGGAIVTVEGNSFDGGTGVDRISVGWGDDRTVVFDVAGSRLRVDGGAWNVMTGFEEFYGGYYTSNRFLDGAGDQVYVGTLAVDRFEFRAGRAGADTIGGFEGDDVVRLRGFGSGLDSFAEVLAATTDTAQGARIDTGAGSSILLAGVPEASLAADDFAF